MLLAIVLGAVLGFGAAWLRRSQLSAAIALGIFVIAALAAMTAVGEDDVYKLAGAMLAAGGIAEIVRAGDDPRVTTNAARAAGAVLIVVGVVLVAVG